MPHEKRKGNQTMTDTQPTTPEPEPTPEPEAEPSHGGAEGDAPEAEDATT
jgi:hypothetical protein